jgi:hypothetical protein
MRLQRVIAVLSGLILVLVTAGCVTLLPPQATPPAPPGPAFAPAPKPGPVDLALFRVDPFGVLRLVEGGKACRQGSISGSAHSEDTFPAVGRLRSAVVLCRGKGQAAKAVVALS